MPCTYQRLLRKPFFLFFKSTHSKSKKLIDSRPEDLIRVEELICEAKFDEAFEIIENFGLESSSTQKISYQHSFLKDGFIIISARGKKQ